MAATAKATKLSINFLIRALISNGFIILKMDLNFLKHHELSLDFALFFRVAIKLFIKNIKANIVLISINKTRRMAALSSLLKAAVKGFIKPIDTNNVSNTAMCAIILFSFLTPLFISIKTTPIKVGIKAVVDGLSEDQ